jgi:hypothetical protein
MALLRSLVTSFMTGDISRDYVTNTVYHTVGLGVLTGPDYDNHAQEILDAFKGAAPDVFPVYQARNVDVKVYDMADAEPRPERSHKSATGNEGHVTPAELAVTLSYYADRNIQGSRGRIFIGPVHIADINYRPTDTVRAGVLKLGDALFNIGGENVAHVLYHPKTTPEHAAGSTSVINHYRVSDSWGVVHRRGQRPTGWQTSDH